MNKLNKILCDEWNSNKNINPITKRTIKSDGPVYNNIEKKCNKLNGSDVKVANKKKTGKKGIINICDEWLNNPNVNPETGKSIKKNGPVYKKLLKLCEEKKTNSKTSSSASSKTMRLCDEWKKNKTVNPETGYKIKENGPKYNYFKELCMNLNKKVKSSSSHHFQTPKSSSSHHFHTPKSSSHNSFHTAKSSFSDISNRELLELFKENEELKRTIVNKFKKLHRLSASSSSKSNPSTSYYSSQHSSSPIHSNSSNNNNSNNSPVINPIFDKNDDKISSEEKRVANEIIDEIKDVIDNDKIKKESNKEIIRNGFFDRLAYIIGF
jgi:hypothetical protein